jgi:hypothetical protein
LAEVPFSPVNSGPNLSSTSNENLKIFNALSLSDENDGDSDKNAGQNRFRLVLPSKLSSTSNERLM